MDGGAVSVQTTEQVGDEEADSIWAAMEAARKGRSNREPAAEDKDEQKNGMLQQTKAEFAGDKAALQLVTADEWAALDEAPKSKRRRKGRCVAAVLAWFWCF